MVIIVKKGGKGSGNFGHSGRPGKVGGSAPGKGKTREQVIEEIANRYPIDAAYREPYHTTFDKDYWDNFDKEGPTLVYHGTRIEYISLIRDFGLKRGGDWMDRPPSVYFTLDPIEARSWSHKVLIEFTIPDKWDDDVITDAIAMRDFDWESAFRIERDIPPEYIKRIKIWDDPNRKPLVINMEQKERMAYTLMECYFTEKKSKRIVIVKGGPGSGHHGHEGRPGKVGGSAPSSRVASPARVPKL